MSTPVTIQLKGKVVHVTLAKAIDGVKKIDGAKKKEEAR